MRARHVILAFGLAASLALMAFGDNGPAADAGAGAGAAPIRVQARVARGGPQATPWVMRVLPREQLVGEAGSGDGAFRSQSWDPPRSDEEDVAEVIEEPPPPSAPPLPFRYIGKALGANGWEVYLAEGDTVHVARPDDVIDGAYRVAAIVPPSMKVVYLPLNQEQGIDIGAGE